MQSLEKNPKYKFIASMCSEEKINFVFNYTMHNFMGKGIIVEIGTFFGAITQALRLGSKDDKIKIITCDYFSWDHSKQKKFSNKQYNNGDDFSKEVRENLGHLSNIEIIKTDFTELKINDQIELMFVDAPKRNKYVISFINIFSKFWIPNQTKILFEDYNQFLSYELPATLHPINHHFKFYSNSCGIVVGEVKKIDFKDNDLKKMNIREWSKEDIIKNWNEILHTGDNKMFLEKDVCIFMHLFDNGFEKDAWKYVEEKKIDLKKYTIKEKFIDRYLTKKEKKKFIQKIKKKNFIQKIKNKIKVILNI